jgi:hypothetical protein
MTRIKRPNIHWRNSLDIATSLLAKGYYGSFLFLDCIEGLHKEYYGHPGWLLWFSIIATHSDLVIFVKEKGKELTDAQKREIAFTPDRVGKKVVELGAQKLNWAKKHDADPYTEMKYFIEGRLVSLKEWEEMSRKTMEPFIEFYCRDAFPDDRLSRQSLIFTK